MAGGIGTGLYTGFVLPGQMSNPVQVWVPCLDGAFSLGDFKNLGKNTLSSIGQAELDAMRNKCSYYYLTQELNAGNFYYNEALGAGTTEQLLPKSKKDTNMPDLTKNGVYKYTHNGSADNANIQTMQGRPCDNMMTDFVMDREGGLRVDTFPNMQTGGFVTMSRWQKVIVSKIDEGTTGVILRVLPWAEDYNNMIGTLV